jgi:hypothetical protein
MFRQIAFVTARSVAQAADAGSGVSPGAQADPHPLDSVIWRAV